MKTILHSFAYSLDFLREQVAPISESDMVAQPHGMMNHPAWTVGHLTYSCQLVGEVLGLEPWLPADWSARYGTGSVPVADPARYETKARALEFLDDARARVIRAVESWSDGQLDQPFPDPSYREVFPTVRHALTQVLVGHSAHHIGQLSAWRRCMGLPPLSRSFE